MLKVSKVKYKFRGLLNKFKDPLRITLQEVGQINVKQNNIATEDIINEWMTK